MSGSAHSRAEQGLAGAAAGSDGRNMARNRTKNPETSTAPLGSVMPATVTAVPASERAGRG